MSLTKGRGGCIVEKHFAYDERLGICLHQELIA